VVLPTRKGQKERMATLSGYHTPISCPTSRDRIGIDVSLYFVWAVERLLYAIFIHLKSVIEPEVILTCCVGNLYFIK
jgi:hypothetical protein